MSGADARLGRPVVPYFQGECGNWAVKALQVYCAPDADGHWQYTGGAFERLLDHDRDHPNEFTALDLLAVTMLSVEVPPRAAVWMLEDGRDQLAASLVAIGPDRSIADAEPHALSDDGPAAELWRMLVDRRGIAAVIAGKLLAAKRPGLIPIYDKHVAEALKPPAGQFWLAMRSAVADASDAIESVVKEAAVEVTPLRAVDIVVWMHQHGWNDSDGRLSEPPTPGT